MSELALHIASMSAILFIVEASSSAYHRIQVGGPANQITTGEIRIDLPSESFQNLVFNITPYSLQNEYSPYYDQYRAGYQPSAYSPPKIQTFKQSSQSAHKSPPQVSYKPAPVVSYKPSPSVPHSVYSYPQTTYNRPTYTQPKVSYSQPTYTQPKVSYNRPSFNPIQVIQPNYQPKNPVYSYKPIKTIALSTKPGKEPFGTYPYQQTVYRQPAAQKQITSVVDLKKNEEITEAHVEELTEEDRSGKTVTENAVGISDTSENIYPHVFKQVNGYNLDGEAGPDSETEEAREAKTIDTDIEDFDQNSVDSVATSTLLPEFIPIIFEESTKNNTLLTTETSVESTTIAPTTTARLTTTTTTTVPTTTRSITTTASSTTTTASSIRRRPVISFFSTKGNALPTTETSVQSTTLLTTSLATTIPPTTIDRLTTTTTSTSTAPTTTRSITTTASTTTNTASSIRRRPVISFFHDLTTSTSPPPIQSVTPPGDIGQSILDKMRTATLTVQKLLDSEEEITLKPTEDKNNVVKSKNEDTDGELLETEIDDNGDEEKSRERRKIVKVRKSKSNAVNQGSNFASHWQNGRWF